MNSTIADRLTQRADFTHKFNASAGRHGWLRLTPAYSVRVVEQILDKNDDRDRILDPFCGTATTALCAASRGHAALSTDINPFLVWFGNAKTALYSTTDLRRTLDAYEEVISRCGRRKVEANSAPQIHNIERWWSPRALSYLCRLRETIREVTTPKSVERTLLLIAFCRTLIKSSNAAFNHQSMSFRDDAQFELHLEEDFDAFFRGDVSYVVNGAAENPSGTGKVLMHDARRLDELEDKGFDLVVTSPPYANRMSYIRELRPYMYWLDYLNNGRDAGELDWKAIGGTWGVATSRLGEWAPDSTRRPLKLLTPLLDNIANPRNANGRLLATYVHKYCEDMSLHFESLTSVLARGAEVHYIVGNSTFYGEMLPVEQIYAQYLSEVGFHDVAVNAIRKRNSKKALVEFDVTGKWR